jgi:hypothetical protein
LQGLQILKARRTNAQLEEEKRKGGKNNNNNKKVEVKGNEANTYQASQLGAAGEASKKAEDGHYSQDNTAYK